MILYQQQKCTSMFLFTSLTICPENKFDNFPYNTNWTGEKPGHIVIIEFFHLQYNLSFEFSKISHNIHRSKCPPHQAHNQLPPHQSKTFTPCNDIYTRYILTFKHILQRSAIWRLCNSWIFNRKTLIKGESNQSRINSASHSDISFSSVA